MALNFAEAAGKKISEIERPPLPPVGTYRWSITKLPELSKSKDEVWEILTIPVRAVEALDNVDMDGYKGEVTGIISSVKFMFNTTDEVDFEKSLFRARTFFERHVKCCGEKDTLAQAINASVNQQFLGDIAWNQDKNDAEIFHANMGKTAPLD